MTELSAPETREHVEFHGPLSPSRAARFVKRLAAGDPTTVVDYGCGWGELLLRVLEGCPRARGTGVDIHTADIARGRSHAAARGLAGRVEFIEGSATDHLIPADVVLSVGAYHAFGTVPEALATLYGLVNPGGRLLFGAECWSRPPLESELANMWPGITAADCFEVAEMADLAVAAGFRPLWVETATLDEWDEFEFGLRAVEEERLLAGPDADLAATLDANRNRYLRGSRGVMGLAYLTLGRPV